MVVDTKNVYFPRITSPTNPILRVPIVGGAATALGGSAGGLTWGLALDSASVYWINGNTLKKSPLAGGKTTTVIDGPEDSNEGLGGFVVDSGDVYVAAGPIDEPNDVSAANTSARLLMVSTDGGVISTLAMRAPTLDSALGGGVAVDDTHVYWANLSYSIDGGGVSCDAQCEAGLYQMEILSVPRKVSDAGTVTRLALTPASPGPRQQGSTTTLVVDSSNVYFTSNGALESVPTGGGFVQ